MLPNTRVNPTRRVSMNGVAEARGLRAAVGRTEQERATAQEATTARHDKATRFYQLLTRGSPLCRSAIPRPPEWRSCHVAGHEGDRRRRKLGKGDRREDR